MKKSVSIIGGGPAALAVAAFLDPLKFDITIYEKNKTLGRKFLVAGKGGFNLTHSEPIIQFIQRYTPSDFFKNVLQHFDNIAFRAWLERIGIPTFIGSSKRVYPQKGIKPITVLNAVIIELIEHGVRVLFNHTWQGWDENNALIFNDAIRIKSDVTIFALGGGSWQITGSDGTWLNTFRKKGIETNIFQASNCAFNVQWEQQFISKYAGKPLKNITIRCDDKIQKGEATITEYGIEGNAIYALSPQIRAQLNHRPHATIFIDLKPAFTQEKINEKLAMSTHTKTSDVLRHDLKLNALQLDLIKTQTPKAVFMNRPQLAKCIKNLEIKIYNTAYIDEAISTVGGIALDSIDKHFQLKNLPQHYCIGEMLDYDAPTGGYLLQACFSMGAYLGHHLNTNK